MARTVIDSVGVEFELETADFFRGLDLADAAIQRFRSEHQTERVPIALVPDTSALEGSLGEFLEGFAQGAREEMEALTRATGPATTALDKVAAGMGRANAGALAWSVGLKNLSLAQDAARQRAELLATANQRLVAGMTQAGREAFAASAGTRAWQQGLAALRTEQVALNSGFAIAGKGADKLRIGFQALALQATGTTPAVANLVSGLLLLGPGSAAVLGVAATAAVLGVAYNLITAGAREAAEAQKKLNEEFDNAIAARNPLPGLVAAAEDFSRQLDSIDNRIASLRSQEFEFTSDAKSGVVTKVEVDNTARIKALEEERARVLDRMGESARRMGEFFSRTPEAQALAKAAEEEARARERAADAAEAIAEADNDGLAAFATAIQSVRTAIEGLPIDRFRTLIEAQREASRARLGSIQLPDGAGVADSFEQAQRATRDLNEELTKAASASNTFFRGAADGADEAAEATEQLRDEIFDVNRGLDALVGAAVNVGAIGDEAARAIGAVQDLGDALANVAASPSIGNILGVIGAGVNVLGSLFGGGPNETEQIQAANTRALERLTSTIEDNFRGLGGADQVGQIVASEEFQKLAAIARLGSQAGRGDDFAGPLQDALRDAGLSFADLERIASDIAPGLELFDSKGRLVAGALDDLAIAIDAFVEDSLKIGEAFQQRLDAINLESRISGQPQDADAAFERALIALRSLPDTTLDDRFRGVDNDDELRAALLAILRDMQNGTLTAEEVGGLTREDIDRLLNLGADALENFTDSINEATRSAVNIPLGFRAAALAFQAQTPAPSLQPFDGPLVNVRRGGDGASLPGIQGVAESIARQRPNITIERIEIVATGRSARDLFDEIVDEAERRGLGGGVTFPVRTG